MNQLLFGDNLKWLQDTKVFPDESVDLVYLDPPFNSNADYNVLFRETSGEASQAQFHAFTDTWSWADAAETYNEFMDICRNMQVVALMQSFRNFLGTSPMMAYLAMMAPRLVELHRVLKPAGSLYLHCDPTAGHYLRIMLDGVFGLANFQNEIIWKRTSAHNDSKRYGANVDIIFFYTKSSTWTWNQIYRVHSAEYLKRFRFQDPDGRKWQDDNLSAKGLSGGGYEYEYKGITGYWRCPPETMEQLDKENRLHFTKRGGIRIKRYLDENKGSILQALWEDIPPINSQAAERLGYPTQKPLALLERIVEVSSNKGDLVLDPFCGCGTTVHAAQKLGRKWIGIDITYLAINLIKRRLNDAFGKKLKFEEGGQPTDFESAKRLAALDKFQFQTWALDLVEARPLKEGSGKGADRGVDGLLYFYESHADRAKILVQVKGGSVKRNDVTTLLGDVNNQNAKAGVLITLEKPSKPMRVEAVDAGRYTPKIYHDRDYPKIQILTIEGLLSGTERLDAPPRTNIFAKAAREGRDARQDEELF